MVYTNSDNNPFTPSFGEVPLVMAGRDVLIREFDRSFSSPTRRPSLTTIISGARGTGKTALLTLVEEHAQQRGWISVDLVSLPGLLEDAYEQSLHRAKHLLSKIEGGAHLSSLGIGPVSVGITREEVSEPSWRTRMGTLIDRLTQAGSGLLLTVDEITPNLDELIQLAAIYQLFVRENKRVALLMAGLPHNTSQLLRDKSVSFLRRAENVKLGRIADFEIKKALCDTFAHSDRTISQDILDEAVELIDGFPFMMQLVGFRIWEEGQGAGLIDDVRARKGMNFAKEEMKSRILLASYQELSPMDRKFLRAMAEDSQTSSLPEIAQRLGKTNSYATQYKNRLLEHGLIEQQGSGTLAFALPALREFLLEQATSL